MLHNARNTVNLQRGDGLSVTDMQNDFLPGGALAVRNGDKVIPPLNLAVALFSRKGLPIFFTRDWHPPDHISFKAQGGPWPPHCIRDTRGAEFSSALNIPEGAIVISKATARDEEEYSTFHGRSAAGITEGDLVKKLKIKRIFIGGLATDYCVLNSVKDFLAAGYEVHVLTDAVKAVNVNPDDGEKALNDMIRRGAKMTTTDMLKV